MPRVKKNGEASSPKEAPLRIVRKSAVKLARMPLYHKDQNVLADQFMQYIETTDCIDLREWPNLKGISAYRFLHCARDNEYFREIIYRAGEIIASRMFKKLMAQEMDKDVYFRLLPIHDRTYREWVMESKVNAAPVPPKLTIQVEEVPSTIVVPAREEES